MSRSAGTQTSTTTSEPPAYLQPYLQNAAQGADQMYQQGGTPFVGPSYQTEQALNLAQSRATNGSPVNQSAQDLATKTMQGGFLGENPYLNATFDRAAQGVTNQVQSNFGRAGRNVGGADAAGVAADRYGNLATDIYGGAYRDERQLMQQTIPFAGQLANQDYMDIGQLSNVGAQREAYSQDQANQPGRSLDEYLARLQGFPGGVVSQSQPMERNILGGAMGGAMAGSQMGPWGMIGGGLLGGLMG